MSKENGQSGVKKIGKIKRIWQWLRRPSGMALGLLLLIGFIGGAVLL